MDSSNTGSRRSIGDCNPRCPNPVLPGHFDSENYNMSYPSKGKCYIFNYKEFELHTKLDRREGTDFDASRLYLRFQELKFEVQIFESLTVAETIRELRKVSREDHSNRSCFVCCILTHGNTGVLYAKDGYFPQDLVFSFFKGDSCPTLVGKPKIFFIQACQGDSFDPGVKVTFTESFDSDEQSFTLPTHADFLVAYSAVPGYCAWKTEYGSWFIQTLCTILQMCAGYMDLVQMLTIVNRRVAFDFQSYTPDDAEMNMMKQVPYFTSTLTRNVKFL